MPILPESDMLPDDLLKVDKPEIKFAHSYDHAWPITTPVIAPPAAPPEVTAIPYNNEQYKNLAIGSYVGEARTQCAVYLYTVIEKHFPHLTDDFLNDRQDNKELNNLRACINGNLTKISACAETTRATPEAPSLLGRKYNDPLHAALSAKMVSGNTTLHNDIWEIMGSLEVAPEKIAEFKHTFNKKEQEESFKRCKTLEMQENNADNEEQIMGLAHTRHENQFAENVYNLQKTITDHGGEKVLVALLNDRSPELMKWTHTPDDKHRLDDLTPKRIPSLLKTVAQPEKRVAELLDTMSNKGAIAVLHRRTGPENGTACCNYTRVTHDVSNGHSRFNHFNPFRGRESQNLTADQTANAIEADAVEYSSSPYGTIAHTIMPAIELQPQVSEYINTHRELMSVRELFDKTHTKAVGTEQHGWTQKISRGIGGFLGR